MKKTALILGATGLTGSLLLEKLITDIRYDTIRLITRKSLNNNSPKVEEHVGDLLDLEQFKDYFSVDEIYCCIGTTASKTKDKRIYRAIDFGIPVSAASLAKKNGVSKFLVVSAMGANAKSSIFYNKTKGEMEKAVLNINIDTTYILRPSLITGDRKENRTGEKIGVTIFKLINPLMVGPFRKYKSIEANTISQAMINLANSNAEGTILQSDDIQRLGCQ